MNAERWQQIKQVLFEATELPPVERSSYLDRACPNPDFRLEVESLLGANDRAGGFLETPLLATEPPSLAGSIVGHYRIEEEIGRGGMAVVYRAVREDDFQQQVAIKIVKRGMDTDELLERFRHERQILAWLNHNNVARLLDGGATADNRPYLVMELVEGLPITEYCREKNLSVEEKLRLFLKVCSAVAYAHRSLVIHRDLKPANILITGDGEPKLLDFGIAKMFLPESTAIVAARTSAQLRLLTPEYASPEQVRGERITAATDIYALGAVLYELLTGEKAHRLSDGGAADLERAICQTDPLKPSEAAPGLHGLRGDLDNIVLKALEKQPDRRYQHMEQLSEDIERHLDGRPVIARPDTITYRLTKFCRRHKLFAASAAAILVTLTGGIIAVSWQARIAQRERAVAERRFDETRKLAWTLLFEIDPDIANLAGATKVREKLLTRGIAFLDALSLDAKGDPGLLRELAEAYQHIAEVRGGEGVSNLGKQDMAIENLRKAAVLREQVLATQPKSVEFRLELCVTLRRLAALLNNSAEGDRLIRRSLELAEAALHDAPQDPKARAALAGAHYQMGERLRGSNRQEAISQFRKAQELYDAPANVSLMHKKIAAMLMMENDPEHSIEELRSAIAIDESEVQRDPQDARRKLDLSFGYSDLGNSLQILHRYPEALDNLRRAEAIRKEQVAADSGDLRARGSLVSITWRIGRVLALSGDRGGAIETLQRAVQLGEALARDFPGNAAAHNQAVDAYLGFAFGQSILGDCRDAMRWWNLSRARAAEWKMTATQSDLQCPAS